MKNFIKQFLFILPLALFCVVGCSDDDIDADALTNFPPSILSVNPVQIIKVGTDFDLMVVFADGASSPLANGTVRLIDPDGNEVGSANEQLNGTQDTIIIPAATLNSADLPLGIYSIEVNAVDAAGQTIDQSFALEVSLQEFKFINGEMYMPGSYNGWTHQPMTLVADFTWQMVAEFDGGEFKFSNCDAWCDMDWGGDGNCEGVLEETTGGGPNVACIPAGEFRLFFNEQNLTYRFESTVEFETEVENGLFLHGSFNEFSGNELAFSLVGDNTWELAEVLIGPNDRFRISDGPFNMGKNWADMDNDGQAEEFSGNMSLPAGSDNAFYTVTFNDRTRALDFEFLFFPSVGIIGDATPTGWDSDTDLTDNGDGTYTIDIDLIVGQIKFRQNDAWDVNWGGDGNGNLIPNGDNIVIDTAGFYEVFFDRNNLMYSLTRKAKIQSIGIIGDATPDGWGADTDMRDLGDGIYGVVLGLVDGSAKFRANDDWPINWGSSDFPSGTGTQDGDDIPVTAGLYEITLNTNTGEYSFVSASIGIIGDATPSGWGDDTDLAPTGVPGEVSGTLTLVDGEAKFRAQNDWIHNWGGSDFPAGSGIFDGPNIPVVGGTYTITFNVNTLEYSFN